MELKAAMWLIMIWIVIVIVFLIMLLRRYTFGKWDADNPNPYQGETLAMPRGVLRAILTLSILFVVILLQVSTLYVKPFDPALLGGLFSDATLGANASLDAILGKLLIPEERFGQLMVAFQMVIAFYFGGKVMHHVTSAEKRVAQKKAEAAVEQTALQTQAAAKPSFEDGEAAG